MVLRTKRMAMATTLAALLALTAAGAPAAGAEETRPTTAVDPQSEITVELPFAGMTVAVDPATGKLRQPTPAQARELAKAMMAHFGKHAAEPVRVLQHRDGMLSAVLSPADMDFSVATVDADGKLGFQCVDSVGKAAEATLATPTLEEM